MHDEDVQDAQMPENVPANLRHSTRHSQRPDKWGHNIYDCSPPSFEEGDSVAHAL